jgi:ribosomal protein L30E
MIAMAEKKEEFVIGAKEIAKGIKSGKVKRVVVAKNCPPSLLSRIQSKSIKIETFDGTQAELGTKIGKPFPIAMVGYLE